VKSPVERHRIRTATDVERRDDSVCAQVKHDQLGISRANRKKRSLFGINQSTSDSTIRS
jgi:hypothetical protein